MNPQLLTNIPFDSEEAWEAFDLNHGMAHQQVHVTMLRRGLVPTFFPIFGFPREDNEGYLLDHWQVHRSQAFLLGLPDVPDLSIADFEDPGQYNDWLRVHAIVHANENLALGLV